MEKISKEDKRVQILRGRKMKALRKSGKLTQPQVAEGIGVSNGAISFIERGIKGMRPETIKNAAVFFGVDQLFLESTVEIPDEYMSLVINIFKIVKKRKPTANLDHIKALSAIDAAE